ncbi:hypothetical protein E2C01_093504 [Portunus trituberculatus]|uniref:Uncharacterized protein n=1 Tax=Portunus trituberculatus TaxID=210409 RepID=A0A5B7JJ51_PORTR|nr:hypothetical protein [Portunus trituberculatus]
MKVLRHLGRAGEGWGGLGGHLVRVGACGEHTCQHSGFRAITSGEGRGRCSATVPLSVLSYKTTNSSKRSWIASPKKKFNSYEGEYTEASREFHS